MPSEFVNTDDCLLMGRALAKTMGYIDYPDMQAGTYHLDQTEHTD